MKQPDPAPQTDEPQKTACAEDKTLRKLSPEQLRKWLSDHRNRLRVERAALLGSADRIKKEIAALDQLLAELTT